MERMNLRTFNTGSGHDSPRVSTVTAANSIPQASQ
jgi:hypothetical protein